jgi:hypothetical protein
MMYRRLAAICLLVLLNGCNGKRDEAVRYATEHAASLAASARPLWVKYTARGGRAEIPEAQYTPEMRGRGSNRVVASPEGVWISVYTVQWNVTGVFVRYDPAFPTPEKTPPDSEETLFQPLGHDVYWYTTPR